jgi:L-fuconolactonase
LTDPTCPADRIDAHYHLWQLSVRGQPWTAGLPGLRRDFTLDELRPQLAKAGMRAGVLVQTVPVAEETPELLTAADSADEIAGVVGWADLRAPDVADRLAALAEGAGGRRLAGIRHGVQDEHDPDWLMRPEVVHGLTAVADAGLVYDLLVRSDQVPMCERVARRMPGLRLVLDHGGKPPIASGMLDPWREHVTGLADCQNVAVKLSGLLTEAGPGADVTALRPYSDHLLGAFGPDWTMFGSDRTVSTLRAGYAQVARLTTELLVGLSSGERAAVFGATAAAWYGLGPHRRTHTGQPCG